MPLSTSISWGCELVTRLAGRSGTKAQHARPGLGNVAFPDISIRSTSCDGERTPLEASSVNKHRITVPWAAERCAFAPIQPWRTSLGGKDCLRELKVGQGHSMGSKRYTETADTRGGQISRLTGNAESQSWSIFYNSWVSSIPCMLDRAQRAPSSSTPKRWPYSTLVGILMMPLLRSSCGMPYLRPTPSLPLPSRPAASTEMS